MFYSALRKFLFSLSAENAHDFSLRGIDLAYKLGLLGSLSPRASREGVPVEAMGLSFSHPVGLAAGLDKNGDFIDGLSALGFSFLELGTLTPRAQPGNPPPRMFRLQDHDAILNRMGFNNKGIDYALERIASCKETPIIGLNIGKNLDTPIEKAVEDYLYCLKLGYSSADYITINISSPNTPGLRELQYGDQLASLLEKLKNQQLALAANGKYVPLAVKLAPDLSPAELGICCENILCHDIDGIIATNTTLDKSAVQGAKFSTEVGGLSGAPLTRSACSMLKEIKDIVGSQVSLIGVGGIMSGNDARERIAAGADLLQIYSGFVYRGPALIGDILKMLREPEN
jgi:dihydroorotate dehydrogenase